MKNKIQVTKIPTKYQHRIFGHTAIAYREYYVLIYSRRNHRYKYSPYSNPDHWSIIADELYTVDLPKPREWHTMISYNDNMYIFGGQNSDDLTNWNDIWEFDPTKERFKEIKAKNETKPRYKHSSSIIGHNMVVFGGISWNEKLNLLSIYSFETNLWTEMEMEEKTPPPTIGHTALEYKNEMYVFGGQNHDKTNNMLYTWSFEKGWNIIDTKFQPLERHGHAAIIFQDKMYIYGGENISGKNIKKLADLFVFDFETLKFREITIQNPPLPRSYSRFVLFRDDVYLFGGDLGSIKDNPQTKDNFIKFNLNPKQEKIEDRSKHRILDVQETKKVKTEIKTEVKSETVKIQPKIEDVKPISVPKKPFKLFKVLKDKQVKNEIIEIEDD